MVNEAWRQILEIYRHISTDGMQDFTYYCIHNQHIIDVVSFFPIFYHTGLWVVFP